MGGHSDPSRELSTSPDVEAAFVGWAESAGLPATMARRAMQDVTRASSSFKRVAWRAERRTVEAVEQPTESRARKLADPISVDSVDPWTSDVGSLAERTRQLVRCGTCQGAKKVRCPTCAARLEVDCQIRGMRGKVTSPKTGNLINCRTCKGTGRYKRKTCRGKGESKCGGCLGKGKVDRYLQRGLEAAHPGRRRRSVREEQGTRTDASREGLSVLGLRQASAPRQDTIAELLVRRLLPGVLLSPQRRQRLLTKHAELAL